MGLHLLLVAGLQKRAVLSKLNLLALAYPERNSLFQNLKRLKSGVPWTAIGGVVNWTGSFKCHMEMSQWLQIYLVFHLL